MAPADPITALSTIIAAPRGKDRALMRDLSLSLGGTFRNKQLVEEPVEGLMGAIETVIRIAEGKPCLWGLDKAQARARGVLEQCRRLAVA